MRENCEFVQEDLRIYKNCGFWIWSLDRISADCLLSKIWKTYGFHPSVLSLVCYVAPLRGKNPNSCLSVVQVTEFLRYIFPGDSLNKPFASEASEHVASCDAHSPLSGLQTPTSMHCRISHSTFCTKQKSIGQIRYLMRTCWKKPVWRHRQQLAIPAEQLMGFSGGGKR